MKIFKHYHSDEYLIAQITINELLALRIILSRIGGNPNTTARKHADSFIKAFSNAENIDDRIKTIISESIFNTEGNIVFTGEISKVDINVKFSDLEYGEEFCYEGMLHKAVYLKVKDNNGYNAVKLEHISGKNFGNTDTFEDFAQVKRKI